MEEEVGSAEVRGSTITTAASKNKGKKKKTRSLVWDEFTKLPATLGQKMRGKCNHCGREYVADSTTGTSNMKRHLKTCEKRPLGLDIVRGCKQIDQGIYHQKLAEAVIRHGYAFMWAEHEGDREIHTYLNGNVEFISRNTMKSECLKLFEKHKGMLKSFLESLPGRVCLTTDLWTSCNTDSYLCLTVHCINKSWKLSSRILNFRYVPIPHTAMNLSEIIHDLVKEWGIEKKIFSITMDNASNMDLLQENLSSRLGNSLVSGGKFFHVRCCAHILNLIVQAGLKSIARAVEKVRDSVKYVKGTEARKIRFKECAKLARVNSSRGLWMDVTTRWNSTYQMLDRALLFRSAFEKLSAMDNQYVYLPTSYEWSKIIEIRNVLKPFQTITNLFSGSDYPTANLYFENVWKIQKRLLECVESHDPSLRKMAVDMKKKFDKYWGDYSLVLSFGVILDPCRKLDFLEARYKDLKEEEKVAGIKVHFENMFQEYSGEVIGPSHQVGRENTSRCNQEGSDDDNCSEYAEDDDSGKTEFEIYISEGKIKHSTDFDILVYWKENQERFPILSTMARDVLSIPITTVASESSFSIGSRVLNKWRSRLLPENCEALIATRSWLYGYEDYGPEDAEINISAGGRIDLVAPSPSVEPLASSGSQVG